MTTVEGVLCVDPLVLLICKLRILVTRFLSIYVLYLNTSTVIIYFATTKKLYHIQPDFAALGEDPQIDRIRGAITISLT